MDPLDLASVLTPTDSVTNIISATIAAIYSDGTVDVDLGANRQLTGVAVLATYTPATGDAVEIMRRDSASWLVLGPIRTSNATTVTVYRGWQMPYNVNAAPVTSGTLNVNAASTKSYRKIDGWSRADVYQGAYSSSQGSAYGYWSGLYFYGSSAFSSAYGQTCTGISIHLERKSSGGSGGAIPLYIAPHVHGSQPSGAPVWWAGAVNVGSLAWGANGVFNLPKSWGQALLDGKIKGFGHRYSGTSAYSIGDTVGTYSLAGHITLTWTS